MNHDKPSMPGPDTYGSSAESLFCNLKKLKHESNREASPDYFEGTSRNEFGDEDETWQASRKDNYAVLCHQSDYNMRYPYSRKGKEHVISRVEDSMSISRGRENSNESAESSNSKRIISRCKRAPSADPELSETSSSKRLKNGKCCFVSSTARQGSSFMSWISTIAGGHMRINTERHLRPQHKSLEKSKPVGFRSFFQALRDVRTEVNASKEHEIAREQLHPSGKETNKSIGFSENLWIRRLLPQDSLGSRNTTQYNNNKEAASKWVINREQNNGCLLEGQEGLKGICDQKVKCNLNQILPSHKFGESELASVFAKRLDAFRHIRPSKVSDVASSSTIACFFCGKRGHNIMKCSELDETELEGLMRNMNSLNDTVKPSCLCIRCFQLNHWAISCPRASLKRKTLNQVKEGIGEYTLQVKPESSSFGENEAKEKQISPYSYIFAKEVTDESVGTLETTRRPSLSRPDIIRKN